MQRVFFILSLLGSLFGCKKLYLNDRAYALTIKKNNESVSKYYLSSHERNAMQAKIITLHNACCMNNGNTDTDIRLMLDYSHGSYPIIKKQVCEQVLSEILKGLDPAVEIKY